MLPHIQTISRISERDRRDVSAASGPESIELLASSLETASLTQRLLPRQLTTIDVPSTLLPSRMPIIQKRAAHLPNLPVSKMLLSPHF